MYVCVCVCVRVLSCTYVCTYVIMHTHTHCVHVQSVHCVLHHLSSANLPSLYTHTHAQMHAYTHKHTNTTPMTFHLYMHYLNTWAKTGGQLQANEADSSHRFEEADTGDWDSCLQKQ